MGIALETESGLTYARGNADGAMYISTAYPNNPSNDSFGRGRTTTPFTIADSKQITDSQPLLWDDAQVSGGGTGSTYNANQASTTISVSADTAGHRVRQTKVRHIYQPGKSQAVLATFTDMGGAVGITKRLGLFDGENGLYLANIDGVINFGIRTFTSGVAVDTLYPQSEWNIDKLDGTGNSRITLDITKTQIFVVDFEWLGVGVVRFGFNLNGINVYCHTAENANLQEVVYMSTPNLPGRYEIINDGTGPAAEFTHICFSVISEGGFEPSKILRAVDRATTPLETLNDTSLYPVIAIRLRDGYEGAGVSVDELSILTTTTTDYRWALILNPTVTGTAFSYTAVADSAIEADVGTTNATTVTGGHILRSGYSRGTNQAGGDIISPVRQLLVLGTSIAGVSDVIVLAVQRLTGTTESFYASLGWREGV